MARPAGEFLICTDQRSLVHHDDQHVATPMQQKAFFRWIGFQYCIIYKQGKTNVAADSLPHRDTGEQLHSATSVQQRWLEIIAEGYDEDPMAKKLLTELALSSPNEQGYSLVQDVIRHHGKIWLGSHNNAFHSAMGPTPFKIMHGQQPKHLGIQPPEGLTPPDLQKWLAK